MVLWFGFSLANCSQQHKYSSSAAPKHSVKIKQSNGVLEKIFLKGSLYPSTKKKNKNYSEDKGKLYQCWIFTNFSTGVQLKDCKE